MNTRESKVHELSLAINAGHTNGETSWFTVVELKIIAIRCGLWAFLGCFKKVFDNLPIVIDKNRCKLLRQFETTDRYFAPLRWP